MNPKLNDLIVLEWEVLAKRVSSNNTDLVFIPAATVAEKERAPDHEVEATRAKSPEGEGGRAAADEESIQPTWSRAPPQEAGAHAATGEKETTQSSTWRRVCRCQRGGGARMAAGEEPKRAQPPTR